MIFGMLKTIARNLQNERDNKLWKMHPNYKSLEKQLYYTFIEHSFNGNDHPKYIPYLRK